MFVTAGHYITLIILVEIVNMNPVYSTTIGFIVSATINYILNYHITFKSNKKHHEALTKFLVIATIGLGLNTLIMYVGTETLKWHYFLAQIIATGIVLFWNFILNKIWTFSSKSTEDQP